MGSHHTPPPPNRANSPDIQIAIDPEAERWSLYSALKAPELQSVVFGIVSADDYVDEANRDIARIIETHLRLGQPCDAIMVKNAMVGNRYSHTDAVLALVLIATDVCTTAHAVYYAQKVRECAIRRKVQSACLDAIQDAMLGRKSASTIQNELASELFEVSRDTEASESVAVLPMRRIRR